MPHFNLHYLIEFPLQRKRCSSALPHHTTQPFFQLWMPCSRLKQETNEIYARESCLCSGAQRDGTRRKRTNDWRLADNRTSPAASLKRPSFDPRARSALSCFEG